MFTSQETPSALGPLHPSVRKETLKRILTVIGILVAIFAYVSLSNPDSHINKGLTSSIGWFASLRYQYFPDKDEKAIQTCAKDRAKKEMNVSEAPAILELDCALIYAKQLYATDPQRAMKICVWYSEIVT